MKNSADTNPIKVKEISSADFFQHKEFFLEAGYPLIIREFCLEWEAVTRGKESPESALQYIGQFYSRAPVSVCNLDPKYKGRIFYNEEMSGFNFLSEKESFFTFIDRLLTSQTQTYYMPSTDSDRWFPGFSKANNAGLDSLNPVKLLWVGNQTRIAAHYDFPRNLACCLLGKRRFTLFPPEQIFNLYPGPLDFAPGGQQISLVDFKDPDDRKFPRFKTALEAAQIADLAAGDALLLPGMWWHHVESLSAINILYTHWWRESPAYLGNPTSALMHAILSIRNLGVDQRKAWRQMFDYHVFDGAMDDLDLIKENARSYLNKPMDELTARKLRSDLINKLQR